MKKVLFLLIPLVIAACNASRLTTADRAYEHLAYAEASEQYGKAFDGMSDLNERARHRDQILRAADACWHLNDLKNAAKWYTEAEAIDELDPENSYRFGQVLLGQGRYEEAEVRFARTLKAKPDHAAARDLMASADAYDHFFYDSLKYTVSELPLPGIVSGFAPVPYEKGLVFVGEQNSGLQRSNPWNDMSFLDLYYCEKKTIVTWLEAKPLPGDVNGKYHEGPCAFAPDGKTIYFTRSDYTSRQLGKDSTDVSQLKMFSAHRNEKGDWIDITEFPYNGATFSVGHPALTAKGDTLYFSSDRPGGSGGSDIWYCVKNGTDWSSPVNAGAMINTAGNELFPTVDSTTFRFSSSSHRNMGGLDIFETHREKGAWVEPVNMGYPINTSHDDMAWVTNTGGQSGYLSSNRTGADRIHVVFVNEPLIYVEGVVFNDSTGEYMPNVEATLMDLTNLVDTSTFTDENGVFRFTVSAKSKYQVVIHKPGMLTESRDLVTEGISWGDTLRETFEMHKAELNRSFVLKNIYFDYDKWDIRPDAAAELSKLVRFINDNPLLVFELRSHTDSRGDDLYNLVLSDARAKSTVDYLVRHGVAAERLESGGYGETMLVNRCANGVPCSEDHHQANRRSEIRLVRWTPLASEPTEQLMKHTR